MELSTLKQLAKRIYRSPDEELVNEESECEIVEGCWSGNNYHDCNLKTQWSSFASDCTLFDREPKLHQGSYYGSEFASYKTYDEFYSQHSIRSQKSQTTSSDTTKLEGLYHSQTLTKLQPLESVAESPSEDGGDAKSSIKVSQSVNNDNATLLSNSNNNISTLSFFTEKEQTVQSLYPPLHDSSLLAGLQRSTQKSLSHQTHSSIVGRKECHGLEWKHRNKSQIAASEIGGDFSPALSETATEASIPAESQARFPLHSVIQANFPPRSPVSQEADLNIIIGSKATRDVNNRLLLPGQSQILSSYGTKSSASSRHTHVEAAAAAAATVSCSRSKPLNMIEEELKRVQDIKGPLLISSRTALRVPSRVFTEPCALETHLRGTSGESLNNNSTENIKTIMSANQHFKSCRVALCSSQSEPPNTPYLNRLHLVHSRDNNGRIKSTPWNLEVSPCSDDHSRIMKSYHKAHGKEFLKKQHAIPPDRTNTTPKYPNLAKQSHHLLPNDNPCMLFQQHTARPLRVGSYTDNALRLSTNNTNRDHHESAAALNAAPDAPYGDESHDDDDDSGSEFAATRIQSPTQTPSHSIVSHQQNANCQTYSARETLPSIKKAAGCLLSSPLLNRLTHSFWCQCRTCLKSKLCNPVSPKDKNQPNSCQTMQRLWRSQLYTNEKRKREREIRINDLVDLVAPHKQQKRENQTPRSQIPKTPASCKSSPRAARVDYPKEIKDESDNRFKKNKKHGSNVISPNLCGDGDFFNKMCKIASQDSLLKNSSNVRNSMTLRLIGQAYQTSNDFIECDKYRNDAAALNKINVQQDKAINAKKQLHCVHTAIAESLNTPRQSLLSTTDKYFNWGCNNPIKNGSSLIDPGGKHLVANLYPSKVQPTAVVQSGRQHENDQKVRTCPVAVKENISKNLQASTKQPYPAKLLLPNKQYLSDPVIHQVNCIATPQTSVSSRHADDVKHENGSKLVGDHRLRSNTMTISQDCQTTVPSTTRYCNERQNMAADLRRHQGKNILSPPATNSTMLNHNTPSTTASTSNQSRRRSSSSTTSEVPDMKGRLIFEEQCALRTNLRKSPPLVPNGLQAGVIQTPRSSSDIKKGSLLVAQISPTLQAVNDSDMWQHQKKRDGETLNSEKGITFSVSGQFQAHDSTYGRISDNVRRTDVGRRLLVDHVTKSVYKTQRPISDFDKLMSRKKNDDNTLLAKMVTNLERPFSGYDKHSMTKRNQERDETKTHKFTRPPSSKTGNLTSRTNVSTDSSSLMFPAQSARDSRSTFTRHYGRQRKI